MKHIDKLGISPWPWRYSENAVLSDDDETLIGATLAFPVRNDSESEVDKRLIAYAPELYAALFASCSEASNDGAMRCYAFVRDGTGHCSKRNFCRTYRVLAKASGEQEVNE